MTDSETKLDIVKILKTKKKGTKLYSSACGKCNFDEITEAGRVKVSFYNSKDGFMTQGDGKFDKEGKLFDDAECCLFPSNEMRDWTKFAWKIGDVLYDKANDTYCIFTDFINDTYSKFNASHTIVLDDTDVTLYIPLHDAATKDYVRVDKEKIAEYKDILKNKLHKEIDLETLEIKVMRDSFKNGDILYNPKTGEFLAFNTFMENGGFASYWSLINESDGYHLYKEGVSYEKKYVNDFTIASDVQINNVRNLLGKRHKYWNNKKKQLVYLPLAFEKVLVRDYVTEKWKASVFSDYEEDSAKPYVTVGYRYFFCIPYNGNEELLGTTIKPSDKQDNGNDNEICN